MTAAITPAVRPDTADPMTLAMLRLIRTVDAWQAARDAATREAATDAFVLVGFAAGADPAREAALRTAASMLLDPPGRIDWLTIPDEGGEALTLASSGFLFDDVAEELPTPA